MGPDPTAADRDATVADGPAPRVGRLAVVTFLVLFGMSLLDWIDRWTLSGVLSTLQDDLKIDDAAAGSLTSFFLISYCLISPLMGYWGDRTRRTRLLALGVGVWSLATIGTGLAQDLFQLRAARSILGIGEATYGVLAPSILMDVFARRHRARVLSLFYLAMPVGYAAGVLIGGWIAQTTGNWRLAFFLVGTPGLLAAFAALLVPEPVRGQSEGLDPEHLRRAEGHATHREDYRTLLVTSSYSYTVFGLAAYTFAFGGMAFWLPTFLERVRGYSKGDSANMVALTGFLAAIVGMTAGGWLADRAARRNPNGLLLVSGTSILAALPCVVLGLTARSTPAILAWLFVAQALLFANTGPSNAVIANVVLPRMRASAYAIATFFIHMLGDVPSPWLMGWISDLMGKPSWVDSPFGDALAALGMNPVTVDGRATNLGAGMLVVVPAIALGGVVLLAGMRHLPREMAWMQARLRAEVAHANAGVPASAHTLTPAADPAASPPAPG